MVAEAEFAFPENDVRAALQECWELAQLQNFVAQEAGGGVGSLTLIASEARLESSLGSKKAAAVTEFLAKIGI